MAELMLKNAPIALSLVKEAVRRGMDTTLEAGLEVEGGVGLNHRIHDVTGPSL